MRNPQSIQNFLLLSTILFVLGFIAFYSTPHAHAAMPTVEPLYKVLTPTANCTGVAGTVSPAAHCFSGMGKITVTIWYNIMAVVNSLVLAMLIWVAFMNILRIQMDSYAVKKILPTFIIAIILANFSFLLARMLIDVANISISAFLTGNQANGVTGAFNEVIKEKPVTPVGFSGNYAGYISVYILKQFFVIAGAVLTAILAFIFLIRNYFIYFLICIAPAAFMSLVLPITKKYFQQWFAQFLKWIFMPVISVFWLWLAGEFIGAIDQGGTWVLPMGFAGLCLYMAITSPFKAGGAAVGAWGNLGKKVWNKTGGAAWNATGGAGIKSAKGWVGDKYMNVKRSGVNWAKDNLPIVKPWARSAARGRLRQDVINSAFEDKDKVRQQRALIDFMKTGEFKRGGGFSNKTFKKLKGQVKKLLLDDEFDAETYKSHPTSFLVGNVALNKGIVTKKDKDGKDLIDPATGAPIRDDEKTILIPGKGYFHAASVEYMAQNNGKRGVKFYDGYGRDMKKKDTEDLIKESMAATKQIKLTANNNAANGRSQTTDLLDPTHNPVQLKLSDHRDRLKIQGTDPRTMTSSAVPGEGMGDEDETGGEPLDETIAATNPILAEAARRRAASGHPYGGAAAAQQAAAERMAAARRGEGVPLADATPEEIAAQNAAIHEMAGQNGQGSPAAPGAPAAPADFSAIESLLTEINDTLREKGKGTVDPNKSMAGVAMPSSVGAAIGLIPELQVRIKSIDPAANEQLRLMQTRVAKASSAQSIRLAQKEESTLQSISNQLREGKSPEEVEKFLSQAETELDKGNTEGAKTIIETNMPNTGPSLNVQQHE